MCIGKLAGFIKICDSATDVFDQADFHPTLDEQEKKIGRQIVTCKLAHVIEPTNRADNSIHVNLIDLKPTDGLFESFLSHRNA